MKHLYNEINPYRAAVLRARIAQGRIPSGTVDERDITTIPDQDFLGFDQVHLFAGIGGFPLGLALAGVPKGLRCLTGGLPCQDISNAGKRAGITGERSGLWREMVRAIRVVRPELVFVENVAALLGRGMGRVVGDLAAIGYDAKWTRVSAADAGAPHLRERIWIMAYPEQSERRPSIAGRNDAYGDHAGWKETASGPEQRREAVAHAAQRAQPVRGESSWRRGFSERSSEVVANAKSERMEGMRAGGEQELSAHAAARLSVRGSSELRDVAGWWATEPDVGRVAHGIPARVDRLAALGDAIVPQACAEAIRRLMA